jgi:hypothetical protein
MTTRKTTKRPVNAITEEDAPLPQRPDPLADDDPELATLDQLKVGEVEDAEPNPSVLDRIKDQEKRAEVEKAVRARIRRMRQFVAFGESDLDL